MLEVGLTLALVVGVVGVANLALGEGIWVSIVPLALGGFFAIFTITLRAESRPWSGAAFTALAFGVAGAFILLGIEGAGAAVMWAYAALMIVSDMVARGGIRSSG